MNFWAGFDKTAKLKNNVTLGDHQSRVVSKLKNTDALLLYHGLGSGKTLSSIAATEDSGADVVVPAALRSNYQKELDTFTTGKTKRNIMSYEGAVSKGLPGGENLVLDEVQRLNNPGSARSQAIMKAAPLYQKRLLLSGTPIRNYPHELAPILRILSPKDKRVPLDEMEFKRRFIGSKSISPGFFKSMLGVTPGVAQYPKNLNILRSVVKGKVDYFDPPKEDYPSHSVRTVTVPMSDEQTDIYKYVTSKANPAIAYKVKKNLPLSKKELKEVNSFMTAARIVSNTTKPYGGKGISPKFQAAAHEAASKIKADRNYKVLAYSNYLEGGIKEYAKSLEAHDVPYALFTGEMSDAKKKEAVRVYNSGKVKALLISGAGAEGLDLKGTRMVQVLEPHWNKARLDQAIGRAIRFKSHAHLPENERHVDVVHYHSVHPETLANKWLRAAKPTSADTYLSGLSEKKDELNQQFLQVLKEEGA